MKQTELSVSLLADFPAADVPEQNAPGEGVFVFPASLEQIRYWTLDQLDGTSTASNMAIAARLEGEVEDATVECSVRALVERHEALRTTFRLVDGQLCQVISEEARYSFSVTDLRSLPEAERAQAAEAAVEQHSHARADLATGPAFFANLIHLSNQLHFLAFTMHHIVCDGWSNGILIRDFTDFYAAFSQHLEPSLPELPFQFADFTVWQQNWLGSEAAQSALEYWRTHIRREMPAVDLPTDRPRLPQKSYPGNIESALLSVDLAARLKAYCRSHDATMHQVMLAAFEALISRYTNQSEFLLGSTIANRTQPGMENVVGRFANPQVILADVSGDPSYAQLLRRVVDWSTESYAHQDLPFSRLMEEFQLDQAGATSQFLQVYFVYQKAFMQPQEAGALKVVPRPSVSGGVNFDLLVSIVERAEGPRLQMEYNTILFRKDRILRLMDMYVQVLSAVMADDTLAVSRLPMGVQLEPATASSTVSSPQTKKSSLSLGEWIDRLGTGLGNSPAIIEGSRKYGWKELLERSERIAAAFTELGIGDGKTVFLRLESSMNDAAAVLAALRIGAVALPLASSATAMEWTELIVKHKPALAVASSIFASSVTGITAYEKLLALGSARDETDAEAVFCAPSVYPMASSIAWLATGTAHDGQLETLSCPHGDTLQKLLSTAKMLDLRSGDAVLVDNSVSAVDAWVDLLLPLAAGCTVVYSSKEPHADLPALIDKHQISFVLSSAATLLTAVDQGWKGDRRLNAAVRGEILTAAQVQRLSTTPLRLWSLLSSARTSGPMAIAKISGAERPTYSPLGDENFLVLDDKDQRTPPGAFGELATVRGEATLRSGYLARVGSDNDSGVEIIDHVHRVVRLHGYRLRLGELEEVLWQIPAIAECLAATLSINGTDTLVAYFRTFNSTAEAKRTVQEHFRSAAPGLVAGAELIEVDSIPRRADGSPDLALLPRPGASKPTESSSDDYVAPRDELEARLISVWEEVLGVRHIGIRTQFFKLGGYSLMIVRLFARINKVLGTSLPITTIFNAPTVEQLADIVRGRAYYSSLVPVRTTGSRPPFFMIHSYLLYAGIPKVMGDEIPFYGLRELETDAQDMTVEQRAATYLDTIRSIQSHGPYYLGGWCAAGPLVVETARQIKALGEEVGFLVLFDSWRPGYAAELAEQQAGSAEMSFGARLGRKYRFHRNRLRPLASIQKARYVAGAVGAKFASVRNRLYLKNWAIAEWFCRRFGLSLPHFMHNVSLTTLNSLKEYRGIEPYAGSMTLIRAKEAPYFPGAMEHCGWNSIVTGGVKVLWAPGDHESMFLDPHLQKVGRLLRESLAEAYSQHSLATVVR